jgi:hypothetical protein
MTVKRDKFDFEIGYFIKSPCRECDIRESFPECLSECGMLDRLQTIIACGVPSCYSSAE